jgi:hypothetical protein
VTPADAPFAELVRLSRTSIADEMREAHRRHVLGLPALRKRRLNKIGFVWREGRGYRRAMEIKDAL